jgi:hypothetical protein
MASLLIIQLDVTLSFQKRIIGITRYNPLVFLEVVAADNLLIEYCADYISAMPMGIAFH